MKLDGRNIFNKLLLTVALGLGLLTIASVVVVVLSLFGVKFSNPPPYAVKWTWQVNSGNADSITLVDQDVCCVAGRTEKVFYEVFEGTSTGLLPEGTYESVYTKTFSDGTKQVEKIQIEIIHGETQELFRYGKNQIRCKKDLTGCQEEDITP